MSHQASRQITASPGRCKLRVVENETRNAIITDTGASSRTIAYVAIGVESWGPLLAAAPDLADALRRLMGRYIHDGCEPLLPEYQAACTALAKAGL